MNKNTSMQLVRLINQLFRTQVASHLKNRIITKSQAEVLQYVQEKNDSGMEVNQIDVQKKFHLTNPTVTGILKRLEEKKLLERTISKKSARCKSLQITKLGREELSEGAKIIQVLEDDFLSCFSYDEKEQFRTLLWKLFQENLEEGDN